MSTEFMIDSLTEFVIDSLTEDPTNSLTEAPTDFPTKFPTGVHIELHIMLLNELLTESPIGASMGLPSFIF